MLVHHDFDLFNTSFSSINKQFCYNIYSRKHKIVANYLIKSLFLSRILLFLIKLFCFILISGQLYNLDILTVTAPKNTSINFN